MATPVAKPKGIEKIIRSRISTGNYKPGSKSYTVNYSLLGRLRNRTQKNGNAEQAKIFENLRTKMEAQYSGTEPEQIVSAIPLTVSGMKDAGDSAPAAPPSTLAALPAAPPSSIAAPPAPPSSLAAPPPPPAAPNVAAVPPSNVQEIHTCPDGNDESFTLGKDELQDGNCFYSSLYKSALHHSKEGLVNRIYELFDGKPLEAPASLDERTFIMAVRTKTAQLLRNDIYQEMKAKHLRNINTDKSILTKEGREGQKAQTLTLFEKLWDNKGNAIYRAWLQESPREIKSFFKEQSFISRYTSRDSNNEKQFYNDMAKFIETWGVYASQTDIDVVKHELLKGGIALETISDEGQKKCMYFERMPVLWLFKQASRNERGELISGDHYGYFRKDDSPPLPFGGVVAPVASASSSFSAIAPAASRLAVLGAPINRKEPVKYETDYEYEKLQDDLRLQELTDKITKCSAECEALKKEHKQLEDFKTRKEISDIGLSPDKKLIDLLIERILDTSDDWRRKIDTLIRIPTSLSSGDTGILRGGDYFEALFQLAIAIGILPQFKGKYVQFHEISADYKRLELYGEGKKTYLYHKTIQNSGGKEQGVSDITFKISNKPDFKDNTSNDYTCGQAPPEKQPSAVPLYFISVKGYKKEKSIKDSYDIPLLDQQINEFPEETNKHIIVCVRDKDAFMKRLDRTKISFLRKKVNYVIGYNTGQEYEPEIPGLMDCFSEFRINFFSKLNGHITTESIKKLVYEIFPESKVQLPMLSLYFHQELVTKSVIQRISEVNNPSKPHFICIGVLPRGGKSYIAGGIIDSHRKIKNNPDGYNVLFLTSAVNETRSQFEKDLINKFSEFAGFDFIDVVNSSNKETSNPNKFYFMSRQLSSLEQSEQTESGDVIQDTSIFDSDILTILQKRFPSLPKFDICFFDEAHIGITSRKVQDNFKKTFERFKIPIILMTATFKKPALFLDDNRDLFVWDLDDIGNMKQLASLGIEEFINKSPDVLQRYPILAEQLLRKRIELGETEDKISKPYLQFPNKCHISLTFSESAIKELHTLGEGYSYTRAFEVNRNQQVLADDTKYMDWGNLIRNKEDALKLREFLTPEFRTSEDASTLKTLLGGRDVPEFLVGKDKKYRALNQIFNRSQSNGGRIVMGRPFSMIMFLPYGFEQVDSPTSKSKARIGEICRIWASFMRQVKYWREKFVFLTLSTYNNKSYKPLNFSGNLEEAVKRGLCHRENFPGKDLKDMILDIEREALKNDKGLVILSGDVAKMGISLKCVDIVCLMTDKSDMDDITQKTYRALTDDPPNKKDGFIIDLNIKRVVTAMFHYDIEKDKMRTKNTSAPSTEERINKIGKSCYWGEDPFIEDNPDKSFNDIMEDIKSKVFGNLAEKTLEKCTDASLMKHQAELLQRDRELDIDVMDILADTKIPKKTGGKGKVMAERGTSIPDAEKEEVEQQPNGSEAAEASEAPKSAKPPKPITEEKRKQIREKLFAITTTFINALVLKTSESFNTNMNIYALLQKYKSDKASAVNPIECLCKLQSNCTKAHDNSYERVYCEIKNYAYKDTGKVKSSGDVVYEYDSEKHTEIMDLIDKIFERNLALDEWNVYIEKLIKEIKGGRYIKDKRPVAFNKTHKKNRH
jgi:hypothetical protein